MNLLNILVYLVVAAVIGWAATRILHDHSNLLKNIIVAVLGAYLAGYFLSPIFHVGTINQAITWQTMLLTLAGAVILLLIFRAIGKIGWLLLLLLVVLVVYTYFTCWSTASGSAYCTALRAILP
jgi:uncharacterized membrane protein YeaQ/YmgE (transglycosylase-associated protein family)